jgi:ABC-type branched-subunit amino acid transport system substrate-binding protein
MINIKQKLLKLTISFFAAIMLVSCQQNQMSIQDNKIQGIVKVAVLLPMSGEQEVLGKQYIQMIKMGLADKAKTKIRVNSYNSVGDDLDQTIEKIIENKTDIIIGPLYSNITKKVAAKIRNKNIILISLSNDPTIAEKQLFVFGHAPMRQLEQMTDFLLKTDYKNYIFLLPAGRHSQNVSKILESMIKSNDALLARVEYYNDDLANVEQAVNIVSDTVDNLNESDANLKRPVVIVADDALALQNVFTHISKYNLDKKAVIAGDNRVNIEMPYSIDLIFTASINLANTNIKSRAERLGIKHVSFMHALAYDAGRMSAEYIGSNYNKDNFLAKLNGKDVFKGMSGDVIFIDSIAIRRYDVIDRASSKEL